MAGKPKANPLSIDTDVQIPEAVRRAAAAADAAMQANNPQPAPVATPPGNDTLRIAPAEPVAVSPNIQKFDTTPAPPPAPRVEHQPQPQPQPADDDQTWKNRYEAMLGRFRDANTTILNQNSRLEALENMLSMQQAAPPTPAPRAEPARLITAQEEQDMGPEMVDIMRRAAREQVSSVEQELRDHLAKLEGRINGTANTLVLNAKEKMHQELDTQLPNWNEINHAQEFHDWLALPDAFTGVSRKKLLSDAYAQNKTPQVLSLFKAFVSEVAATLPVDPQLQSAPAQVPAAPAPQPSRPTLESLAAPGRARTSAAPQAPAEKQSIRTSDVNAFYAAVRRGAYKGREDEQRQHEAELFAAMRENRIVQDT